jgi:hypothetical protein
MLLIEPSTGEACFPFAGTVAGPVPLSRLAPYIDLLSDLAFHRLADPQTIQRDLDERVRTQHL